MVKLETAILSIRTKHREERIIMFISLSSYLVGSFSCKTNAYKVESDRIVLGHTASSNGTPFLLKRHMKNYNFCSCLEKKDGKDTYTKPNEVVSGQQTVHLHI